MKRLVVPSLFCMGVTAGFIAIAPVSNAQAATPKVVTTATYRCDAGKGFKAEFRDDKSVRATFGTKVVELPNVESASGAKSSDGSVTLFTKGDEAMVDVGDKRLFANCVTVGKVSGLW